MSYNSTRTQVVITGIGAVTAGGLGATALWDACLRAQPLSRPTSRFEMPISPAWACHVPLEVAKHSGIPERIAQLNLRWAHLGIAAAMEAWADARMGLKSPPSHRLSCFVGTACGPLGAESERDKSNSPWDVVSFSHNSLASVLGDMYSVQGASQTYSSGNAASGHALSAAIDDIHAERSDVALVVGAESPINELMYSALTRGRTAYREGDETAMKPFDVNRYGCVIGEAGAALVIESEERARRRGAHIYAVIGGVGITNDGYYSISPRNDSIPAARAMAIALDDSDLNPRDVGFINTHGCAGKRGDAVEVQAISHLMGKRATAVPLSSTKPITGHTIGADSLLDTVVTTQALRHGVIPPTANLTEPDPQLGGLDFVYGQESRELMRPVALSLTMGFGGSNVAVALYRP